jgi:hypothetical protein
MMKVLVESGCKERDEERWVRWCRRMKVLEDVVEGGRFEVLELLWKAGWLAGVEEQEGELFRLAVLAGWSRCDLAKMLMIGVKVGKVERLEGWVLEAMRVRRMVRVLSGWMGRVAIEMLHAPWSNRGVCRMEMGVKFGEIGDWSEADERRWRRRRGRFG